MLSVIGHLRRLALSVEQRDTLPHGSHEGFVGTLELLGFLLFLGLAATGLWVVAECTQHPSQLSPTFFLKPQGCSVWRTQPKCIVVYVSGSGDDIAKRRPRPATQRLVHPVRENGPNLVP